MKKYFLFCVFFFLLSGVSFASSLSSDNGRFVFGQISEFSRDQYMLDTQTGMLWQIVISENKTLSLQPVMYNYFGMGTYFSPGDIEKKSKEAEKYIFEDSKKKK